MPKESMPPGDGAARVDATSDAARRPAARLRTFLAQLAAVSGAMNGTLTPAAVGGVFESRVAAAETQGWFLLSGAAGESILMRASSSEAPLSEIEFNSIRAHGVTLADLEGLYGTAHHALPAAKEGTTVIFKPEPSTTTPEKYIAAVLDAPKSTPGAVVTYLVLRYTP
jgi:hypothetical protein